MLKISDLTYDWKLSDIDKVQKNKLKVFSFFAGAGGSSMGYKLAGCDVLGCLDIDKVQLNFTKFYMRILFKVKNWRISQINFATNIISHAKEKCPVPFLRHSKIF
jgi:hypothetical protein